MASLAAGPWFNFQIDTLRAFIAVTPAACFWGASFPLALAAVARADDPGRTVGGIYAANTLGAIAGFVLGWTFITLVAARSRQL